MPFAIASSVTAASGQAISRRFATSRWRTLAPMNRSRVSTMLRAAAAACTLLCLLPAPASARAAPSQLAFQVREGGILNYFLREGPVSAHLVLRSGRAPRILIAFPAGNSGVGLWFAHPSGNAAWRIQGEPSAVHARDGKGRALYGLSAQVTLADRELDVHQTVLSSVRVLRDYQSTGSLPKGIAVAPLMTGRMLTWSRDRLDGAVSYRLTIEVLDGRVSGKRILAGTDGSIGLRITGLTGEAPLAPLAGHHLLRDPAAADPATRETLTFL